MGKGSKTAASAAAAPRKDRTTKIARLRQMLTAADGVTVSAACATLGWKPHSVRAALSGLRKAGLVIERRSGEETADESRYRIVSTEGGA